MALLLFKTPEKLPESTVNPPAVKSTFPAPTKEPIFSAPPSTKLELPATVTAEVFNKRSAAPNVVVPLAIFTVAASLVPFNATLPLLVIVPVPKLALITEPSLSA